MYNSNKSKLNKVDKKIPAQGETSIISSKKNQQ